MSLDNRFGENVSKKTDGSFYDHVNEKKLFFFLGNISEKKCFSAIMKQLGFAQKKARIEHENVFLLYDIPKDCKKNFEGYQFRTKNKIRCEEFSRKINKY